MNRRVAYSCLTLFLASLMVLCLTTMVAAILINGLSG
jgi:hypothetical protein